MFLKYNVSEPLGFLDFVHFPVFLKLNTTFWKLDLLPPSCEGRETPNLLGVPQKELISITEPHLRKEMVPVSKAN
jgi:hypothetical protein